jgi:hypothetical protein
MKTSIIFSDNLKQVVLTPETDSEKLAMEMFTADDNVQIALKHGSIYSCQGDIPFTANIAECSGGYLRCYNNDKSIILVLRPKDDNAKSYNSKQAKRIFDLSREKIQNGRFKYQSLDQILNII